MVFLLVGAPVRRRACGRAARRSIANLTAHGGFAPNGLLPVLTGAVAATGFYFGAEIVTIAAAEAAEPAKAVASATNSVITRVLVFYVGSILLVVCLVPWNSQRHRHALRQRPGRHAAFPAAAQIMNAVVLTAVLSALNSGLYASSRMLFALTERGDAPRGLAKLSRNGVPRARDSARHGVRLRRGGHVVRVAGHGVRLPGQFVRHRGDIRLSVDRRVAAAAARAAGAGAPGATAAAHVGVSVSHLSGHRRHAGHPGRHGLHPRSAHAADLRPHQPGGTAAGVHHAGSLWAPVSGRCGPDAATAARLRQGSRPARRAGRRCLRQPLPGPLPRLRSRVPTPASRGCS